MTWAIPMTDVRVPEEDVEAVLECLRSGWLTMGPRIADFERALAGWTGAAHAATTSSGASALHLACLAVGLGPGDEVIVPSAHAAGGPCAAAVRRSGATPVPCEPLAPERPVLGSGSVERLLGDRTRAVLAVHPWGWTADAPALRALCDARGLALIEDARAALGAERGGGRQAGTVGHLGCFSFGAGRQLPLGEGGAVVTDDPELDARVRLLRSHAMTSGTWDRHRGHHDSYDVVDVGHNHRMDEPRAALGLARLPRLADEIAARRRVAAAYRRDLVGVPACFDDDDRASPLGFAVLAPARAARAALRAGLAARGIETAAAGDRACVLPVWPHLSPGEMSTVIDAIRVAFVP